MSFGRQLGYREWSILAGVVATFGYFYRYEIRRFLNYFYRKIPEDCPGPESDFAGQSESCKGCPNAQKCRDGSAKQQLTLEKNLVNANLSKIRKIILVMSGKGGVGKSTVSTQLAFGLEHLGHTVGLLDIDVTGPSIPGMTNTVNFEVHQSVHGWTPIYLSDKMSIMSIGYLMDKSDSAVIWRGAKKESLIKQFLQGVYWDELDFLVIDCPPATYLKGLDASSIIVTTSQKRCVEDSVRSVDFCKKVNIPILGVVENMTNSIFDKKNTDTVKTKFEKYDVKTLVRLPLDDQIIESSEKGVSIFNLYNNGNASSILLSFVKNVVELTSVTINCTI